MASPNDLSYIGKGIVRAREYGSANPFFDLGNVSAFTITPNATSVQLANARTPNGGNRNRIERLDSLQLGYTWHDLYGENIAAHLRGTSTRTVAGNVADEAVVAYPGGFVPLSRLFSAITEVTDREGATTYTEGTDYQVVPGGLLLLAGSTIPAPVDGVPNIAVSYTAVASEVIEPLTTAQKYYEMVFVGENEAQEGKQVRYNFWRVSRGFLN
ncbi:MAG TPA: hypothetical protein VGC24_08675 [Burkholderiaceae bacterium]